MEAGFRWTPYNQHLSPQKALSRWVGTQSKHFQIRYAEVGRLLAQAETIVDYTGSIDMGPAYRKEDI